MVPSAQANLVSNAVELAWLTRYPLPNKVIVDRRNEFVAEFKTMIQTNYGIKVNLITSRNPQADSISEWVHQMIGNVICTFKVQDMILYDESLCDGILVSTFFSPHKRLIPKFSTP